MSQTILVIHDDEKIAAYTNSPIRHYYFVIDNGVLIIMEDGVNARGDFEWGSNRCIASFAPNTWTHVYLDR